MTGDARLSAGEFYGQVAARRTVAGLILTETCYRTDAGFPVHSHDLPYFCFLVTGANVEQIARCELDYRPFATVFHPGGEEHSGLVRAGSRLFVLELPPGWVARVPGAESVPRTGQILPGRGSLQLAARLYHEFHLGDAGSLLAIEELAGEMLALAARSGGLGTTRPVWLSRVEDLLHAERLHAETDGRVDLLRIAREARVHPVHVARVFRRHHGLSMGAYRRRLKVEAACSALARPGSSLASVAAELGFVDQSHFTRTFKALTGLTPGRFRAAVVSARFPAYKTLAS